MTFYPRSFAFRQILAIGVGLGLLFVAVCCSLEAASPGLPVNGGFEADADANGWPDGWGGPRSGLSWEGEPGNRFLRLTATEPGRLLMLYNRLPVPAGAQALELGWRWRTTGLVAGEQPWFDARILLEFHDAAGEKISPKPAAPYARGDTKGGWVRKSVRFLVPPGAASLDLMPSLFQVKAGTLDLDDLTLTPVDPAPILAAAKESEALARARYVPPEAPRPDKWPQELRVRGNRLVGRDGKEVWLQGLNAGGMESVATDTQPVKSVVVGIDEWKAGVVRLPIKDDFWFGRGAGQTDEGKAYRERVDQIVTLAANRGAYVVIDLHRFRAPKAEHVVFWKDAAERYKNHPAVLFDLFNEPHGVSWQVWRDGGFVGERKGVDESAFLDATEKKKNEGYESVGMQALVDAVRSTGAKNIVVAGGLGWAFNLSGVAEGYELHDPEGNGIMYSWHVYNWHRGWEKAVLAVAAKHPILVGEVGADVKKMDFIPHGAQEDPFTWVPDMLGFIQKHRLNWTGWCFHPRATPVMISDWNYTPTPFWGVFAKEALAGKQFESGRLR